MDVSEEFIRIRKIRNEAGNCLKKILYGDTCKHGLTIGTCSLCLGMKQTVANQTGENPRWWLTDSARVKMRGSYNRGPVKGEFRK
jgi:hypothetical protein